MARLYRRLDTVPRAERPALEALIATYSARYTSTEDDMSPVPQPVSRPRIDAAPLPIGELCALCRCRLTSPYNIDRGLCGSCQERPEAKTLPRDAIGRALPRPRAVVAAPVPRAFTVAETSLIRALSPHVPVGELLRILNDRRAADLGADAVDVEVDQLHAAIRQVTAPAEETDWAGQRKLLAHARASGLLASITDQTLTDFSVAFQLTPAQAMRLRDVITHAKEER